MADSFNQWLQSRLTAHGFPCGVIDGILGSITINALKAFQTKHGIPATGTATADTVAALRLTSSAIPAEVKAVLPDRDKELPESVNGLIKNIWPRQKDMISFYGPVGTNQGKVEIPFDLFLAWEPKTRIKKITLHNKVCESATRIFNKIGETFSADERKKLGIDLFGGSLNVRKMRGGNSFSMHSWGTAIDFDPIRNGLHMGKNEARLAKDDAIPFWEIWEAEGWVALGRVPTFGRDFMHVQAARL